MTIYSNSENLQSTLNPYTNAKKRIGFVPTMGALHQGHGSLVKKALLENDVVVVSIYVNPTQFNNAEDLEKYPKTLKEDVLLLEKLQGKILVFCPSTSELYPKNIKSKEYYFQGLENEMEGKHRKGHFNGVGTILELLFNIILPTNAYFGEKDFQQLQIVKKLVENLKLPITIVGCPIIREHNGLAMSSRNKRLTPAQFEEASLINKTLLDVKKKFQGLSISKINKLVKDAFKKSPTLQLEYFEIASEKTLKTAYRKTKNRKYRAFIAVFVGKIRLIDNIALN